MPIAAAKWATVEPVVITKSQFAIIAAYSRKSSGLSESAMLEISCWRGVVFWLFVNTSISDA